MHELHIPDDLIEWGKANARLFARPWAHELEHLLRAAPVHIDLGIPLLEHDGCERLLALLEALCAEAVRHGQDELLLGLDMWTAEWLQLRYTVTMGGKTVRIGRGGDWSYAELRVLLEQPEALDAAQAAKDLVAEAFPRAQIGAIIDPQQAGCVSCGTLESVVYMTLEGGNRYCGECYSGMVGPWPVIDRYGRKTVRER